MLSDLRSIDLFAGGGGASEGIVRATRGVGPLVAINHDVDAIYMHAMNHPGTMHLCESVWDVEPFVPHGEQLDLLWASPDCKHFSRAKGSKPLNRNIRALAWVIVKWAEQTLPKVIAMENVPEFLEWGPLYPSDHPDPKLRDRPIPHRKGETFKLFIEALEDLTYDVEWRELVACDYGAPTLRKRLFLVARCDGKPIRWPKKTHGPGRLHPYRTAAECIDWDIPACSIFASKSEARDWAEEHGRHTPVRPLADKTMARIAEGVRRYVLTDPRPFIMNLTHGGRLEPIEEPFRTITAAHRGEKALVIPYGIQTRNSERRGQTPRTWDVRNPYNTITAKGSQGAVALAFLAKHNGGVIGHGLRRPLGTVTSRDHHALVSAFVTKYYGTSTGSSLRDPLHTVTGGAGGGHMALVAAMLVKYYGTGGQWQSVDEPLHTIVSKARFGLVTVDIGGETYTINDIQMRMLEPRELARAQGFQDEYVLTGNKTAQIARIGNSVPPPVVQAIVEANFRHRPMSHGVRAVRAA